MLNKVKIAIDAMGGIDSPKKIIDGIEISLKIKYDRTAHYCYCQTIRIVFELKQILFTGFTGLHTCHIHC